MSLKEKLKQVIVDELKLEDISPDQIEDDTPLFGLELGLDSIDAVEIVYLVKKYFAVEIRDMKEGRSALQTINTLAAFIERRRSE
jgi:acyl carrier protein